MGRKREGDVPLTGAQRAQRRRDKIKADPTLYKKKLGDEADRSARNREVAAEAQLDEPEPADVAAERRRKAAEYMVLYRACRRRNFC